MELSRPSVGKVQPQSTTDALLAALPDVPNHIPVSACSEPEPEPEPVSAETHEPEPEPVPVPAETHEPEPVSAETHGPGPVPVPAGAPEPELSRKAHHEPEPEPQLSDAELKPQSFIYGETLCTEDMGDASDEVDDACGMEDPDLMEDTGFEASQLDCSHESLGDLALGSIIDEEMEKMDQDAELALLELELAQEDAALESVPSAGPASAASVAERMEELRAFSTSRTAASVEGAVAPPPCYSEPEGEGAREEQPALDEDAAPEMPLWQPFELTQQLEMVTQILAFDDGNVELQQQRDTLHRQLQFALRLQEAAGQPLEAVPREDAAVNGFLRMAKAFVAAGNVTAAQEACEKAMTLEKDHPALTPLLGLIEREIAAQPNREARFEGLPSNLGGGSLGMGMTPNALWQSDCMEGSFSVVVSSLNKVDGEAGPAEKTVSERFLPVKYTLYIDDVSYREECVHKGTYNCRGHRDCRERSNDRGTQLRADGHTHSVGASGWLPRARCFEARSLPPCGQITDERTEACRPGDVPSTRKGSTRHAHGLRDGRAQKSRSAGGYPWDGKAGAGRQ